MTTSCAGSCVCGGIAFAIRPPYSAFQYCHCSRCRKRSGSAFVANIFVPPEQFEWTRGEALVRRFELATARAWSNAFCATCGSSMPWLGRSGKLVIVPAGALDGDPGEPPRRNVHFDSHARWYVNPSELPFEPA